MGIVIQRLRRPADPVTSRVVSSVTAPEGYGLIGGPTLAALTSRLTSLEARVASLEARDVTQRHAHAERQRRYRERKKAPDDRPA